MYYYYKSRVGTFYIYPDLSHTGRYLLKISDNICGSYDSPVAAADDVYVHVTGYYPWDRLDGRVDGPTDLSEWHVVF